MQVFHCDYCDNLVFFENTTCIECGHALAYLPDTGKISSLELVDKNLWQPHARQATSQQYHLCRNYTEANICNWAIPAEEEEELCTSCRLTQKIPDLTQPNAKEYWYKLEVAKRRLLYSLFTLGCPVENKQENPEQGLSFEFLADPLNPDDPPVLTGHANGVITLNIAEADDVERKRRQLEMGEPYRTLLGHFRHEVGHYYWDRLIRDTPRLEEFREMFGDERDDYGQALQRHYEQGPPANWQDSLISEYASAHPWEDWAETWAHYLHMVDTLETAAACGVTLRPRRRDEPAITSAVAPTAAKSFDQLIDRWFPLTYVLNNLNRGLGLADGYPFVLSPPVVQKLEFVHDTIRLSQAESQPELTPARWRGTGFWSRLFSESTLRLF